jgi:hypothetical protein
MSLVVPARLAPKGASHHDPLRRSYRRPNRGLHDAYRSPDAFYSVFQIDRATEPANGSASANPFLCR